MPNDVIMSYKAARAALCAMHVDAGSEEVEGFLAAVHPSQDLLSQAMRKFTNIESRILLAQAGAPLMPALKQILTNKSCNFDGMKQLINAATLAGYSPTEDELRFCMVWATLRRDLSAVQFLIGKGAPVAGKGKYNAVKCPGIQCKGIDYTRPNLFTIAILSGDHEMVALFLQLDPAVINQTYGQQNEQYDSELFAKGNMMNLNSPAKSFAALSEASKEALFSAWTQRKEKLKALRSDLPAQPSEAIILSVLAACLPGFIGFEMYISSDADQLKTAGLVFLGLAALLVVVGVASAVFIEQSSIQEQQITAKIAELKAQGAAPSAPPPLYSVMTASSRPLTPPYL